MLPEVLEKPAVQKLTYNVEETARVMDISRSSVNRLIEQGVIPVIQCGNRKLIPIAALEKTLAEWKPGKKG